MKFLSCLFLFLVLLAAKSEAQFTSLPSVDQPCPTEWSELHTDTAQVLFRKTVMPVIYQWYSRVSCRDSLQPVYYDYYLAGYALLQPDKIAISPREADAIVMDNFLYHNFAAFPTNLDSVTTTFRLILDACVEREFTPKMNISEVKGCGNEIYTILEYFQREDGIMYKEQSESNAPLNCPSGCVRRNY